VVLLPFRDPCIIHGFSCFLWAYVVYFAYIDEFGHLGPFISRYDKKYKTSPVFGLGGFILPACNVRTFSSWFYHFRNQLLALDLQDISVHPATWEKKGSDYFSLKHIQRYSEVRQAAYRIFNKLNKLGGRLFYVGCEKDYNRYSAERPEALYHHVLREAMKRLNQFADLKDTPITVILDEHQSRTAFLTSAAQAIYGGRYYRITEPPFQAESKRYHTLQCADWLCALYGHIGKYKCNPIEYPESLLFITYFEKRIAHIQVNSSFRLLRKSGNVLPEAEEALI
jgi:Protein of unknown function (DUF3800)